MKSILGLALLFGALTLNAQDPPTRPSPTSSDTAPLTAAQRRARLELNEAAQSYREGNFAEARRHTETAREYDPLNKTAPLFLARIIHREYKPGDQSPENIATAFEAIEAYRRILADDPQNEEAYKAIASVYGAIKEDELQRQWILQRAVDATIAPEKRAEGYVVLASKDWHCSNEITDLPSNQTMLVDSEGHAVVTYKKPKEEADFQTAKRCLESGMEEVEMAVALDPESEAAWSYKTNLLIEASKLAEMEGRSDIKADLDRQANVARRRTEELNQKNEQQREQRERGFTNRPEPPKTIKPEEPKP